MRRIAVRRHLRVLKGLPPRPVPPEPPTTPQLTTYASEVARAHRRIVEVAVPQTNRTTPHEP